MVAEWPFHQTSSRPSDDSARIRYHQFPLDCKFRIRKTTDENVTEASKKTIETLNSNFYVVDCKICTLCLNSYFPYQSAFQSAILRNPLSTCLQIVFPSSVHWEHAVTESDLFEVQVEVKAKPSMLKGILSMVSHLFGPFGLVQPFLLPIKALMQKLSSAKIPWDQDITEQRRNRWEKWPLLPNLSGISMPRCFKPLNRSYHVSYNYTASAMQVRPSMEP